MKPQIPSFPPQDAAKNVYTSAAIRPALLGHKGDSAPFNKFRVYRVRKKCDTNHYNSIHLFINYSLRSLLWVRHCGYSSEPIR